MFRYVKNPNVVVAVKLFDARIKRENKYNDFSK